MNIPERRDAHNVCVAYHALLSPTNCPEKARVFNRAIAAGVGITRQSINTLVNNERNLLQGDTCFAANFQSTFLINNCGELRRNIAAGLVSFCMKPLFADNSETVRGPCFRLHRFHRGKCTHLCGLKIDRHMMYTNQGMELTTSTAPVVVLPWGITLQPPPIQLWYRHYSQFLNT